MSESRFHGAALAALRRFPNGAILSAEIVADVVDALRRVAAEEREIGRVEGQAGMQHRAVRVCEAIQARAAADRIAALPLHEEKR